jgi:hypothetical protein
MNRKGEKIGWVGGWVGAFSWLLILSIVLLLKGEYSFGSAGIMLFLVALFLINILSPWNQPNIKYWVLLTPLYAVFIAAVIMCVWSYGGFRSPMITGFSFIWLIPIFIPYLTIGNKTWDNEKKE